MIFVVVVVVVGGSCSCNDSNNFSVLGSNRSSSISSSNSC